MSDDFLINDIVKQALTEAGYVVDHDYQSDTMVVRLGSMIIGFRSNVFPGKVCITLRRQPVIGRSAMEIPANNGGWISLHLADPNFFDKLLQAVKCG
jgi:hypothetical protein